MFELADRISYLSPKIDSGRFKMAEKQELDRLIKEYLAIDEQLCRRCKGSRDDAGTSCSKCRKEIE
jgi:hypothetical protein